jgi:hypothetical protein
MTLQLSHIFFTDALTFISTLPSLDADALLGICCMQETIILTPAAGACNLPNFRRAISPAPA